jgi:SRP40, C-terminal domain
MQAHKVLINVRGKDFRHEKTKRKRGNYRGGTISLASNSYKFDA